jgi:hypothetical protein
MQCNAMPWDDACRRVGRLMFDDGNIVGLVGWLVGGVHFIGDDTPQDRLAFFLAVLSGWWCIG